MLLNINQGGIKTKHSEIYYISDLNIGAWKDNKMIWNNTTRFKIVPQSKHATYITPVSLLETHYSRYNKKKLIWAVQILIPLIATILIMIT